MDVYFDNAATTSVSPAALEAMLPLLRGGYGNPSSLHAKGQAAKRVLDEARETVAAALGARTSEVFFTSGGTEADNWALTRFAALGRAVGKTHLISTAFEHHAVLNTLKALEREGFTVTLLPVHEDGLVRPEELEAALTPETALVSVMHANNEVGTIQPIRALSDLAHAHGAYFHTDAVQTVGHIPVSLEALGADALSLSAHKFHGAKGAGALLCRRGIPLGSLLHGGGQERGRRAGTENLPGIAAMAAALRESCERLDETQRRVSALRDRLIDGVLQIPGTWLNGNRVRRLPGNASFSFEGIAGESLLLRLDMAGVCASSGSACMSGSIDPSHVLLAMGLPRALAYGSLRLTLDRENTEAEVDSVVNLLQRIIPELRAL